MQFATISAKFAGPFLPAQQTQIDVAVDYQDRDLKFEQQYGVHALHDH